MFLRIFKHLLPHALAWLLTTTKQLRDFFAGLAAALGDDPREYYDDIFLDLYPETTRDLSGWENQFALPPAGLTEQERRDRLAGAWQAVGGQSPGYIQTTLQAAGFDVYVHDWWVPGTEPPIGINAQATARNPSTYLFATSDATQSNIECGEPIAACGEVAAEAGNVLSMLGYPLVNKIFETVAGFTVLCGEPLAECGEPLAESGETSGVIEEPVVYTLPIDATTYPYFFYIGAPTFGDLAAIPNTRRDEFEELCLKICPAHLWLGILVAYT